jgi:hypothetical protein
MSEADDFNRLVHDVQQKAVENLKQFLFLRSASIAQTVSEDVGKHWGSGSYLDAGDKVFLLTNRHIAEKCRETTLSHVVKNGEEMAALAEPYLDVKEIDLALMPIRPEIWATTDKVAVPLSALNADRPTWDELLMVVGFPGATSRFSALAKAVRSKAMPYIAQADAQLGDDGLHFWMKNRPAELKNEMGHEADWVDPHGMSGSMVWNTGIVKSAREGIPWSPNLIKPAGLLDRSNHEKQALRVIRLDVVRETIRAMLASVG